MALLLPFAGKLVRKYGKKELCGAGGLFSAVASFVLFFIKTSNPYVFMSFCFLNGLGMAIFILEIWALVTDVIDYQEYLTHQREEGICYSLFSFTRKLGQTFAVLFGVYALNFAHYDAKNVTAAAAARIYDVSVLVPAFFYLGIFIFLTLLYPLGKAKLKSLHENEYKVRAEGSSAEV